jgi:hypothetical protein
MALGMRAPMGQTELIFGLSIYGVTSFLMGAVGAFVFTDSMPLRQFASVEYPSAESAMMFPLLWRRRQRHWFPLSA